MSGKVLTYARTAFIGALLATATLPALAAPTAPDAPASSQGMRPGNGKHPDFRQMLRERIQARMDRLASRLEIKASQQGAWKAFVHAVLKVTEIRVKHPGTHATAAQVAHYRAKRALKLARVLENIARKTDRLEAVLDKNQRAILDNAFRNYPGMRHGSMRGHGNMRGQSSQGMRPGGMNGGTGAQQR